MNVKTQPFNPSLTALVLRRPFSVFVLFGALSITGLVALSSSNNSKAIAQPAIPAIAEPSYAIQSVKITSPTSGTAIITLNDFILNVDFNYVTAPDSYGPHGSEFTNVEVSELKEIKIKTLDGTEFRDFTNANDHQQINAMIVGYILQHHFVEGV